MIPSLYPIFQKWSTTGSVYIISDTHFEDSDCKLIDANWITPQEHIDIIKSKVHKNDTLVHLGDVGRPHWLEQIKGYKILIQGNHDKIGELKPYFNEIYTGPLMIAQKIMLSHEPIPNVTWCLNIHGHNHNGVCYDNENPYYLNIASNVVEYQIINLKTIIKDGYLSKITDIHRQTIDKADIKKKRKGI